MPPWNRSRFSRLVILLSFLFSGNAVQGRITDAFVVKDDRQTVLIDEAFGFSSTGHIELQIKNFRSFHEGDSSDTLDFRRLGFFINPTRSEAQLELDLAQGACGLEANSAYTLLTFDQVLENQKAGPNVTSLEVAMEEKIAGFKGGEYALFFENCERKVMVSFEIRVAVFNVRSNGNKDYLSVGEDMLPGLYMAMFVLFTVAGAIWGYVVHRAGAQAHRIHYLMGVLVAAKALTVLSQAGMYHLIRAHGHPDGWNFAYYIFTFLRGLLFFTVIVLVGTGWSYMKPLLATREKRILMIVIPLQVFAEVAIVILDEGTPASRSWFTWRDILHVVDIICCCAILFPIVWSINHLRKASQTDGKAARNLIKLQLFQQFYVIVVSYVYFTRILVYLMRSTLNYEQVWVSNLAEELGSLAFYGLVGFRFRPQTGNPYLELSHEDESSEEVQRASKPHLRESA